MRGVNGRLAVLRSTDVQRGIAAKFDLRPFEAANLDRPQAQLWQLSDVGGDAPRLRNAGT